MGLVGYCVRIGRGMFVEPVQYTVIIELERLDGRRWGRRNGWRRR